MSCYATGSLAAGGTGGDGQSGNATDNSRTLVRLWPTGQPEIFEAIPSEFGGVGTLGVTFDGGGSQLDLNSTGDVYVPHAAVIQEAVVLADQVGDIVVDIWKSAYAAAPPTVAGTICAAAKPTLTDSVKSRDTTLTGWTKTLAAGDVLRFNVDSSNTLFRATVILKVNKTGS